MPVESGCPHDTADAKQRICVHLLADEGLDASKQFTGVGTDYDLLCDACWRQKAGVDALLRSVCAECFARRDQDRSWPPIRGQPQILERPSSLRFEHEVTQIPGLSADRIVDLRPLDSQSGSRWIALTKAGNLVIIDLASGDASIIAMIASSAVDLSQRIALRLSPDGNLAAIVNVYGQHGIVLDLADGRVLMTLDRGDRYNWVTPFPLTFAVRNRRTLLVHATAWNRLDVSDPLTAERFTERPASSNTGKEEPPHYLDYCYGELCVSPDGNRVASFGWTWHPVGSIQVWSLPRWLEENVWESEDGQTKIGFLYIPYVWDVPYCWVDDSTIAVWGYGFDADNMIPAVRLFDATSGQPIRWFAGPDVAPHDRSNPVTENWDPLVFDRFLFSVSRTNGTSVWDISTGERLLHDPAFRPDRCHRGSGRFVTALGAGAFQISRLIE